MTRLRTLGRVALLIAAAFGGGFLLWMIAVQTYYRL